MLTALVPAVARDRAGAFAQAAGAAADAPALAAFAIGWTGNFYLDVTVDAWEDYVVTELAWLPFVLVDLAAHWHAAARRPRLTAATALARPTAWPGFLRAYAATVDWCFGPGASPL